MPVLIGDWNPSDRGSDIPRSHSAPAYKGDVVQVEVVRGICAGCDEAAAEAVMQAKFVLGIQRGRPVRVRMMIPVEFRIAS